MKNKDEMPKDLIAKIRDICKEDPSKDYKKELGKAVKLAKLRKMKKSDS